MGRSEGVATIMLAGGRGSRLFELTSATCKPALSLIPGTRIVDFTMQNLALSGLQDILVATQYQPKVLHAHLNDRWQHRFQDRLHIREGTAVTGRAAGYLGTADAVRWNLEAVEALGADIVLCVAADHVYRMDLSRMIAAHRDSGAAVTVAASVVPVETASAFGIIEADAQNRIVDFIEKPQVPPQIGDMPGECLASMGIYVFDFAWLAKALRGAGMDFGYDILPEAFRSGLAYCHRAVDEDGLPVFWRDVGTLTAFRETSIALQSGTVPALFDALPCRSEGPVRDRWSACGTVVMPGAVVATDARLERCIVAPGAQIGSGEQIGIDAKDDARWYRVADDGTTLVTQAMLARRRALLAYAHPLPRRVRRSRSRHAMDLN